MWALWASGPSMKYDEKSGSGLILHWCWSCEPCGPLGLPSNMIKRMGPVVTWVINNSRDYMSHESRFMTLDSWIMIMSHELWTLNYDSLFIILDSWFRTHDSWFLTHDSWFLTHDSWFLTHDSWFTQWADSCTHWWNCKPNFQLLYGAITVFNSLAEEED